MSEALSSRLPHIYLIYGLAFFALGLALSLELGRILDSNFKRALRALALFGLVLTSILWARKVKGAFLIGIIIFFLYITFLFHFPSIFLS